jgi:hypothetical protein
VYVDSFIDDLTHVRNVKARMEGMICYIPGKFVMILKIFDSALCMIVMLDLLVHPKNSIT